MRIVVKYEDGQEDPIDVVSVTVSGPAVIETELDQLKFTDIAFVPAEPEPVASRKA